MIELSIATLQGATLVLESACTAPRIDLNVTEVTLSIEILPDDAGTMIAIAEESKVDLIEVALPSGGQPVPAPVPASLAKRVEMVSDDLFFRGEALTEVAEDAPAWRLRRIEIDANDEPVITWAGGTDGFVHQWAARAALIYSPLEGA